MPATIGTQDFVRQAVNAAHHFGFTPIERLKDHPHVKDALKE